MTPNCLPIISRWHEQGIGFLPSVDIYDWDKQGSGGGAKKRTICKMSHQHSTALQDIRRAYFLICCTNPNVSKWTKCSLCRCSVAKEKPVQTEQLERRISLFKNKQLWYEIVKGLLRLTEDFLCLCASWIQSQTCYCGRSNLKARREEDLSKLIMATNILKEVETWKSKIISLYPKCQNSRTLIISDIILCRQKVLFWHLTFSQNTQYCVPTIQRGQ